MLGGDAGKTEALEYCAKKSSREAADFCNVMELPDEAMFYVVEWAAAEYLTETSGFTREWERLRKDAEMGLMRYRRIRW
jgi:hypothetical protein